MGQPKEKSASAQTGGEGEGSRAALPGAGAPDPAGGLSGSVPGGFRGPGRVALRTDGPAPAAAPDPTIPNVAFLFDLDISSIAFCLLISFYAW